MKFLIPFLFFLVSFTAQGSVEVMFHPYDNTMEKIADIFYKAESSIDMALYNVDKNDKNPVIKALMSDDIQGKIKSGKLLIRLLFEGYMSKKENREKMEALEAIGIDVRYLGISRKMHHKFATIDAFSSKPILISGSANWSMMSQWHYNENIMFFEDEQGITMNFQNEFETLWDEAKDIGRMKIYPFATWDKDLYFEEGLGVKFNTKNFDLTPGGFKKSNDKRYILTREIVKGIDRAEDSIKIATTRLKLRPIYDAILRAVARGVKVKIIVTQGEYLPLFKYKYMKPCDEPYQKECSTSQNFAQFLVKRFYSGHENVEVRVKYFDLRSDNFINIAKQMHSKYMVIDDNEVLTGSFNWSYSGEYNHFENLISVNTNYFDALDGFVSDFNYMWDMGRDKYDSLFDKLDGGKKVDCRFTPMSLTFSEVDELVIMADELNICQVKKSTKRNLKVKNK